MTQIDTATPTTEYRPVATRPPTGVTWTYDGAWVLADEANDTEAFIAADAASVIDCTEVV